MARAAARVQLAAVGHVEDPISPVTARGQSHALANQENGPQEWECTPTELARFIRERAKAIEACAVPHNQLSYACSVQREVLPMLASRSANRT